ncbi:hypothetical protein GCM10023090_04610 [Acidovorax lacteus]|uniref:Cell surface protein n=2 Tax=Acidovorax lacteus TaxID=1924988 RepID=A0ABP8KY38_9BURK
MIGGLGFAGLANAGVHAPAANQATALSINEAGTGHILIVPYFTTQGTNATLLNITNTDTSNGKLVKIRFRGASNSDDIFDFTLALSPGDVWAAKVSQGTDGRSQLETSDKSCTLPSFVATQRNSFPTGRLNPALTDAQKANETREGYIEILTMADIPSAANSDQFAAASPITTNPLFTAIKHVNGVAPCTTATLNTLRTDSEYYDIAAAAALPVPVTITAPTTRTARGKGLNYPTGRLMANWTIIDTVKTATFSGAAVAVRAAGGAATDVNANIVFFPQSDDLVPNAGGTALDGLTADPLLRSANRLATNPATGGAPAAPASATPFIAASYYDLPDLSTPYLAATTDPRAQAQALTAALAAKSVINEYLTTTSIAATTDWVFSMPTRRYNVAVNYRFTSPLSTDSRVYTTWTADYFDATNTSLVNGQICVAADSGAAGVNQWDREETTTSSQFVISPGTVNNVRFCGETSVLAFNNGTNTSSGSLSASVALQNLNVNANEGWVSLGTSGLSSRGLPVLGAAFAKSSAFGAVWPHRYTR